MINRGAITRLYRSGNFLSLAAYAVIGAGELFLIAFLARATSKEEFGGWMLYMVYFGLAEILRTGFTHVGLVRFVAQARGPAQRAEMMGSGWALGAAITAVLVALDYLVYFAAGDRLHDPVLRTFLLYYPAVTVFTLVINITVYLLQAEQRFREILTTRLAYYLAFAVAVIGISRSGELHLEALVMTHIWVSAITALLVMGFGWARLGLIAGATRAAVRQLFSFGKFCAVTNYGANLLKSSDTLLIGLMLTRADVAVFAVPLKIITFVEVFLSGLADVALPKMAQAHRRGNNQRLVHVFYEYAGIATLLLLPPLLLMFLFPDLFIYLFAGQKYVETGTSALVLQVFIAYGLCSAIERFTGVALVGMGRPDIDLAKVFVMVFVNAVGDALVIHYFQSLPAVALVTVLNVVLGILIGAYFINREVRLEGSRVLRHGWRSISRACGRLLA